MKRILASIILPAILFSCSHLAAGQAASGSLDDELLQAAGNGDTATVEQLLSKGAKIEAKDPNGRTALLLAASNGKPDVARVLLDKGANIEATDIGGSQRSLRRPSGAKPKW